MNDALAELRRSAAVELDRLDGSETGRVEDDAEPVDELVAAAMLDNPRSDTWLAVIEELALTGPTVDRPAGAAATLATTTWSAAPVSVEQALRVPRRDARMGLRSAFALNVDAADELLERPAAALTQRPPQAVRALARIVGRPVGELFADIAASARASSGFVYAYRPGESATDPAASPIENSMDALVDWGHELLS